MNNTVSTGWLMDNRATAKIKYHEPATGMNEAGEEVTCDHAIVTTVDDAIMISRRAGMSIKPEACKRLSDLELLEEYVVVHWAVYEDGRPISF